ncbi:MULTISPECIES: nucleotidyltransferase family protein [Planktothricoides]|uniref:Nucleotidyltransferase family protein n=1 Tax=Planktothricoides raciborskii FACHB-1370 TaxID=2949576 RepID=A0ABR8EAS4_9CYAN|nr:MULTISPECIES: nucleotidyltransferase family protein [Planktothricoides]KOR38243.1 nucleotidyltransferase [Planktothricoides sp. SR001]MBD2543283.1 nucleotidyltransferase family protein [Planktothricoides raciborskii FACHB-1370]MBD2581583.1 nucleotidyltransferase family protein [Planktothricoides raciborskii FACHB-1261]
MNSCAIERGKVLEVLGQLKPILKDKYGVIRLGIFGSFARNEATESSDVDVVLEMEEPNLFMIVHIKAEIEKNLGKTVDLVRYRERMNPYLKCRIDREAIYV